MSKKISLSFIAFFQALALILYCGLIAILFWKGNEVFGKDSNYFGPLLFLVLFATSALVCAFITLGYSVKLYLKTNNIKTPLKLIFQTILWLLFFILLTISVFVYYKYY